MKRTKVWHSFNEVKGAGFFIWSVYECDGVESEDVKKFPTHYLETLDGTYILHPICDHFWLEDTAASVFYERGDRYTEIVPVGDGPVPF